MPYDYQPFPYIAPPGLSGPEPRHKVIIVGAGPIGLAAALELANHGTPSVVLDDNNVVSVGSRAICWSKRSLEIMDRLGIGEDAVRMGVTWKVGRTFHRDKEIFNFDLLPEEGHKMPAFVNLQQYHVEEMMVRRALDNPLVDLRFKNRVKALEQAADYTHVTVETPDGDYVLKADYLLACDGARSPLRSMMNLDFEGELFEERFLIADIEMEADFPAERRFWFEPTFHRGQSALLHKQPDNIYRIDLQLGWDADPEEERKHEKVIPRIEQMLGHSDFQLEWVSVYTFHCRRLEKFVHGRVIFLGDSAHVVSPFGARGGNGGMQDVDALGWRLAAVVQGKADPEVLKAYDEERQYGADENMRNSSRTTRFMTPADGAERLFRDAVLSLANKTEFAQEMVNGGRLSRPCVYPLTAPDDASLPSVACPGSVAPDAPIGNAWLSEDLGGTPALLVLGDVDPPDTDLRQIQPDVTDVIRRRYLGDAGSAIYLIRPDQVVAARWVSANKADINAAVATMWGGQ